MQLFKCIHLQTQIKLQSLFQKLLSQSLCMWLAFNYSKSVVNVIAKFRWCLHQSPNSCNLLIVKTAVISRHWPWRRRTAWGPQSTVLSKWSISPLLSWSRAEKTQYFRFRNFKFYYSIFQYLFSIFNLGWSWKLLRVRTLQMRYLQKISKYL